VRTATLPTAPPRKAKDAFNRSYLTDYTVDLFRQWWVNSLVGLRPVKILWPMPHLCKQNLVSVP